MSRRRLLVFAKAPVEGQAKSRLIPALGPAGAAELHARMVRHTCEKARRIDADVELWCHLDSENPLFTDCEASFGVTLRTQAGADLGERMYNAFAFDPEGAPAVVIGTDCPSLEPSDLAKAFAVLESFDAVVGPATDGGYYLLGLRKADASLFHAVTWGTGSVLAETRARLESLGLRWLELEPRDDIDRPEDLESLPVDWLPTARDGA
ncbi:TIGR04282 family arsenosugar biosynthesis glycosyltransferase [Thioalkalivibrio sp. ALJ7]|uniref:TIGR04282 family arsenosugar biosynthesis glycosyltransferase n=1 Tax=Thioalkalivibrio sp. ALJ7 TaxID=1158756 RepID=UPI0003603A09|nr:TIGR04282 family arsenosugar biosynthesis glycosyltransferase [Thioalkalivibrio sp. ALJ7]